MFTLWLLNLVRRQNAPTFICMPNLLLIYHKGFTNYPLFGGGGGGGGGISYILSICQLQKRAIIQKNN